MTKPPVPIDPDVLARLHRVEALYGCPLRREEMVEHVKLNAPEIATLEIDRLHEEREWLTRELAKATGQSIAQVREAFQAAVGYRKDPEA